MATMDGPTFKSLFTKTVQPSYTGLSLSHQAPLNTRTFAFAIPNSYSLLHAYYAEQNNEDIIGLFTVRELTIPAAGVHPGTTYKLYYYQTPLPTAGVMNLVFTN
jgi:hypothetical protein